MIWVTVSTMPGWPVHGITSGEPGLGCDDTVAGERAAASVAVMPRTNFLITFIRKKPRRTRPNTKCASEYRSIVRPQTTVNTNTHISHDTIPTLLVFPSHANCTTRAIRGHLKPEWPEKEGSIVRCFSERGLESRVFETSMAVSPRPPEHCRRAVPHKNMGWKAHATRNQQPLNQAPRKSKMSCTFGELVSGEEMQQFGEPLNQPAR